MNISLLIQAFRAIVQAAFANRNDPKRWGGWIDVHGPTDPPKVIQIDGCFKSARVELSGLKFVITVEGEDVTLEGRPNLHQLDVYVDGVHDPEARVANPALKPTLEHPLRTALDFRPVTYNGHECRFNLRYNG